MQWKDFNDKHFLEEAYKQILLNELNERDYLNGMTLDLSRTFSRILHIVGILKDNVDSKVLLSFIDEIESHLIAAKGIISREYKDFTHQLNYWRNESESLRKSANNKTLSSTK